MHIYPSLPRKDIARLPNPWKGLSQGQKTYLAPSSDKETFKHDKEHSNYHSPQSTYGNGTEL